MAPIKEFEVSRLPTALRVGLSLLPLAVTAAMAQTEKNPDGFAETPKCSSPTIIAKVTSADGLYPSGMKATSPRFDLEIYTGVQDGKPVNRRWTLIGDNRKGQLCRLAASTITEFSEAQWYRVHFKKEVPEPERTFDQAEWIVVPSVVTDRSAMLLRSSIARSGPHVKALVLFDWDQKQEYGSTIYRSALQEHLIDCDKAAFAVQWTRFYRGKNGTGELLHVAKRESSKWQPAQQDTYAERALEIVCKGSTASAGQRDESARAGRQCPQPLHVTVRSGNTLNDIAREAGQSARDILRWNGLEAPNLISVGQVLRVQPPECGLSRP